jgi:hypothetical protein
MPNISNFFGIGGAQYQFYYTFAVFFKEEKRTGEGGQTSRLSLFFFFIGQTGRLSSLFSKNCESIDF